MDLFDFGLHHQLHVGRDLSQRSGDQTEEAPHLGDAISHRVPRDLRLSQAKLLHHIFTQPGLFQNQWHLIDGFGSEHRNNGVCLNVAEKRNLLTQVVAHRIV